jgi:hypothetical protein
MKKVAIIQSNYIPWKGYFDIIHDVDLFVFLDDVQYTVRDWRNRNRIKTPQGVRWLTVPVGSDRDRLIHEVQIVDDNWAKSHWEMLKQNYSKTPHFKTYKDCLEHFYLDSSWTNLSELNQHLVKMISRDILGIKTEFKDSREFNADGYKLERLLDLLIKTGAEYYLSGPSANDYIDGNRLAEKGIELHYKDYSGYPEYPQLFPPFEHGVTILDLLFHCGPDAPFYIWGWREEARPAEEKHPMEVH